MAGTRWGIVGLTICALGPGGCVQAPPPIVLRPQYAPPARLAVRRPSAPALRQGVQPGKPASAVCNRPSGPPGKAEQEAIFREFDNEQSGSPPTVEAASGRGNDDCRQPG